MVNERELQKLAEVVFERLKRGENGWPLQVQLARRLGLAEAERLISEARRRVEAEGGEVNFVRTAEEVPQSTQPRQASEEPGRYWRGPIVSHVQAEMIARRTAYVFGGFGLLGFITALTKSEPDVSMFILILLLVLPSLWLWKSKSSIAAGILVGLSGLTSLLALLAGVSTLIEGGAFAFASIAVAAVWALPLWAALRAFEATRYLRKAAAPSIASAFD